MAFSQMIKRIINFLWNTIHNNTLWVWRLSTWLYIPHSIEFHLMWHFLILYVWYTKHYRYLTYDIIHTISHFCIDYLIEFVQEYRSFQATRTNSHAVGLNKQTIQECTWYPYSQQHLNGQYSSECILYNCIFIIIIARFIDALNWYWR